MSIHLLEVLLALAVVVGWPVAWRIGYWRADRQCCACCTCDDCEPRIEGIVMHPEPRPVQMDDFWDATVSNLELHAVVPEGVSRPDDAPPGGSGPGHTTSTWLMERRLWMDAHYPIPAGA